MKRQSIAEITLNKQITSINEAIKATQREVDKLNAKISAFTDTRDDIERERDHLRAQRVRASEKNNPANLSRESRRVLGEV